MAVRWIEPRAVVPHGDDVVNIGRRPRAALYRAPRIEAQEVLPESPPLGVIAMAGGTAALYRRLHTTLAALAGRNEGATAAGLGRRQRHGPNPASSVQQLLYVNRASIVPA
jgi:hypothetical protein